MSSLIGKSKLFRLLALFASYTILQKLWRAYKYRGKKLPPGSDRWVPLGIDILVKSFLTFGRNFHRLEEARQIHGNTFAYHVMGKHQVIIFEPACIQHFLAKNWENYEKGPIFRKIFDPFLGTGIFNVNGEEWKFHRQTARPHFQKIELSMMVPTFTKHAKHLVQLLEKSCYSGEIVDVQDIFFRFTMDSVGEILFGHSVNSLGGESKFAQAFDAVQQGSYSRYISNPLWKLFSTKKFDDNLKTINDFVDEVIDKCLSDPNLSEREDLLASYACSEPTPSREYLKDMLRNMLIAGRDTTAILLTWFFYELAKNPDVEAKIRHEIDEVIGDGEVTGEKLDELRYLKNALNETLRLHPSVPTNFRTAVNDDVLPNGYFIEAGTSVFYYPYMTHRIKEYWGPDADTFNPTRFEPENIKKVPAFAFVPFHAGPRICLGQNMAYAEAKVAAVLILQKFSLQLAPNFEPQYRAVIILQSSNGMKMTVRTRAEKGTHESVQ